VNTISVLDNLNSVEMNWFGIHRVLELELKIKNQSMKDSEVTQKSTQYNLAFS